MKIFKRKHFQALIYSIFLSLPLLSVLGRCVYTIVNKNAKDSYYGETINEVEYSSITSDHFIVGNNYRLLLNSATNGLNVLLGVDNLEVINFTNETIFNTLVENQDNITSIYFGNNDCRFYVEDSILTRVALSDSVNGLIEFQLSNGTYNNAYSTNMSLITYNDYSYLDNAFEYSIDRFVSENDYGQLDFFTWFSSLFLSGNSLDSLYIHFINWYMNYILYVSLGYLIFSVLLWFVNFFRRLVDDTQNINVGGM